MLWVFFRILSHRYNSNEHPGELTHLVYQHSHLSGALCLSGYGSSSEQCYLLILFFNIQKSNIRFFIFLLRFKAVNISRKISEILTFFS